jgi:flagellar protein FliO/FliZ
MMGRLRRAAFPFLPVLAGCVLACASALAQVTPPAAAPASAPAVTDSQPATVPAAVPVPAPEAARAAPGRPPSPAAPAYAPSPSAGSFIQTLLSLTLVLALLAGLAWVLKRFGPRAQAGAGGLRIVGALNLGGRERIMLVEVGDQWIVVGASPGRVNALATMPKQESVPPQASLHPHVPPASSFSEWLKQTIDKRNAK